MEWTIASAADNWIRGEQWQAGPQPLRLKKSRERHRRVGLHPVEGAGDEVRELDLRYPGHGRVLRAGSVVAGAEYS